MSQTLPSTMRVVEIAAFGPPERLAVGHRAVPAPTPWSVLVKVAGAGVNRADVMQRRGQYPPPKGASDLLGLEVSGTVAAVGDDVSTWTVGDRVCGLVAGGGYAEYCVVPVPQCLPIPDSVTLADAAALPEAAMTVWTNVFDRGRLRPGERLLVHGGSSGIGTTAIQLARLWGAEVFATAGTAEKCAACESLGATRAINYRETEFAEAIRTATDGRGVDVILDMVGGPYLSSNLESLAPEGRLVVIGLMGGTVAEVDLATLMSRRLVLTGSTLRSRSISQKGAIVDAVCAQVWPWIADARFRPVIHERYSLDDAAEAHRTMEASNHIGKLLLLP